MITAQIAKAVLNQHRLANHYSSGTSSDPEPLATASAETLKLLIRKEGMTIHLRCLQFADQININAPPGLAGLGLDAVKEEIVQAVAASLEDRLSTAVEGAVTRAMVSLQEGKPLRLHNSQVRLTFCCADMSALQGEVKGLRGEVKGLQKVVGEVKGLATKSARLAAILLGQSHNRWAAQNGTGEFVEVPYLDGSEPDLPVEGILPLVGPASLNLDILKTIATGHGIKLEKNIRKADMVTKIEKAIGIYQRGLDS
ncbi:hypothetical protein BOTBODRAFT_47416 [Botryobasidium botryosum FD-172 SS1]|uniref:Uncharacterized protein n=1 Tax=Botryobasidium botryosum (strain FD-172 SS1) TaxID=930990 RepID=A0A067M573_BOTB1|nr:hypothetical protein BOTBODRAFT_47416 [Botryobasidium botryosum FD-172 SS1]